jgi:hypothetical protein
MWLKDFGGLEDYISYIPSKMIVELSGKTGTVTRARRKIQHDYRKYLPTDPDVLRKRKLREEDFKKAIMKI